MGCWDEVVASEYQILQAIVFMGILFFFSSISPFVLKIHVPEIYISPDRLPRYDDRGGEEMMETSSSRRPDSRSIRPEMLTSGKAGAVIYR